MKITGSEYTIEETHLVNGRTGFDIKDEFDIVIYTAINLEEAILYIADINGLDDEVHPSGQHPTDRSRTLH